MASSDKNAAGSIAGGNSTQPTQPVSKAESSAVAGQLLTALKGSGAKPSSHEARLGIMVITILVFAFGFLVYHKMDLHQQNLTKASIAPNGATSSDLSQANPVVGIVNQELMTAANDPLVNVADLSDGSPFADADVVLADPAPEKRSVTESFDRLNEPAFTPPERAEQGDEPVASQFAADVVAKLEPTEDSPAFVVDQPRPVPDFTVSAPDKTESSEFTVIAETPTVTKTATVTDSPSSIPESTQSFAEIKEESLVAQTETSAAQQEPNEISFDVSADETSSSEPEREPEPVLLAMAEPQQSEGFDKGFLQDDSAPTAKAAKEEPVEPQPVFPSLSEQTADSARQKQHSDSRGFNAVKNPGGRKAGSSIRTAAGSGSDGKFSLAAFNYQNGVSQSAPDDGSTFDSVVVQNGDNYTKISKRVYGTVKYFSALAVFNQHRIPEPKNMRPGMVVLVPAKEVLEERYPEFFVDSQPKTPEPAEFLLLEDGTPAYRVGERETISEISSRFLGRSSRWIEIYRLNQSVVQDPNKLKAGLILALPADAAEVNVVP